jgi:signal transduction histidine kinase
MTDISIYAIPPLVSALFMCSLAVVTLVSAGRERLGKLFAAFCAVVAASSFFGFMVELAETDLEALEYVRLEFFFMLISLSFANFYAMEMTGDTFGGFRHQRIVRIIVAIFVVVWGATIVMLYATDWMLKEVTLLSGKGVKLSYGPAMWVLLSLYFVGTIRNLVFLVAAYRRTPDGAFREFIKHNILAFHTVFAPAIWLLFVLPVFGWQTQVLAFVAFPVAVLIFYVAIVRVQYRQVQELNVSLEQKVDERTFELKRTQARLAKSERMASLGKLAAGVAHEMNNPVGAVRSMASSMTSAVGKLKTQLLDGTADPVVMQPILNVIENAGHVMEEGTRRITGVVDNLKSFARLDEADLQRTDVNQELEGTLALLEHVLGADVAVRKDFGELPEVVCYPSDLNQVFLNILINAGESIDGGGTIVVSTRDLYPRVQISIEDTGQGIADGHLEKVFEPGFTTKGSGVGTGLGLAICYQIVRDHDGEIRVDSEPGAGTTVTIELPVDGPGRAVGPEGRGAWWRGASRAIIICVRCNTAVQKGGGPPCFARSTISWIHTKSWWKAPSRCWSCSTTTTSTSPWAKDFAPCATWGGISW